MTKRIIAISVIFACSCLAWLILTIVVDNRTTEKLNSGSDAVGQLWGNQHIQTAPEIAAAWMTTSKKEVRETKKGWEYVEEETLVRTGKDSDRKEDSSGEKRSTEHRTITRELVSTRHVSESSNVTALQKKKDGHTPRRTFEVNEWKHASCLSLASTDARVKLDVDYRKRGLLWFSTYRVDFEARYQVVNPFDHPIDVTMTFGFPSASAIYDNMAVTVPGIDDLHVRARDGQMISTFRLPAKKRQEITYGYQSRGLDSWNYRFGQNIEMVKNFSLVMVTNFDDIDFPLGSISPDAIKGRSGKTGRELSWQKKSLVSGLQVGMLMPHKINPGPLASAMSAHAPISLFFYFFVIFMFQVLKSLRLHPMHYFFIAASFFSFNLLFSYLVTHLDIFVSFALSSAVSIFLVVSYLRLVVHKRFALVEAGISQLIYQIFFSIAHFLEGYTGLTVTIGAIVTLAVVMRLTSAVDWEQVFKSKSSPATPTKTKTPACESPTKQQE